MQPLIPSTPASATGAGETSRFYLWASCLVAALGGLMFGYDWVVISGADIFYEKYFNLTSASDTGWAKGCALGFAIMKAKLPETKGKTLEEIERELVGLPAASSNPH